jgi:hypothetical protein
MSGLKSTSPFNFGFMAGVRTLRDDEYRDEYKMSLKPPGSSNFVRIAQEQFNMEEGSGYMAEEPGQEPAWRKKPQHLNHLVDGEYGTTLEEPADEHIAGVAGNWAKKMKGKKHTPKPLKKGYDGCVAGKDAPPEIADDEPEEGAEVSAVPPTPRPPPSAKSVLAKGARSVASSEPGTIGLPSLPSVGGASNPRASTASSLLSVAQVGGARSADIESSITSVARGLAELTTKAKTGGGGK